MSGDAATFVDQFASYAPCLTTSGEATGDLITSSISSRQFVLPQLQRLAPFLWWTVNGGTIIYGALDDRPSGIRLDDSMFTTGLLPGATVANQFSVIRIFWGSSGDSVVYPPTGFDPEQDACETQACYDFSDVETAEQAHEIARRIYELARVDQTTIVGADVSLEGLCFGDLIPGANHFVSSGTFEGVMALDQVTIQGSGGPEIDTLGVRLTRPTAAVAGRLLVNQVTR